MFLSVNLDTKMYRLPFKFSLKGFFLFKFDLKSGYHHVEIFPDPRKYLVFSWDSGDGVVKYFQFTVLPFGLSSAPYLFTKLLNPILTFMEVQRNSHGYFSRLRLRGW